MWNALLKYSGRNIHNSAEAEQAHADNREEAKSLLGVSYSKVSGKFTAKIYHNKQQVYLGTFNTAREAAKARDEEIVKFTEKKFKLNYPINK